MNAKYKQTTVGRIPEDWQVAKMKDIFELRNGRRPEFSEKGKVPVYGANGIMGFCDSVLTNNNHTLIIGRVGASGEIHLAKGETWISDNAIYSERYQKSDVHPRFAFFLLKFKNLKRFATKTTHPIITQTFLNSYSIPLPPVQEQKKIAEVLGCVDDAIRLVDECIAKTERLKKGLMQKLLTEGIGHKEFKQTKIGKTPKTWKIMRVKEILTLEYGKGLPERQRVIGEYPVVGSNGIIGYHNQAFVNGPGIVVGRKGTIGAVSWLDSDFWSIDTTYYVRLKRNDVNLKWLFFELTHLNLSKFHLADVVPGLKRDLVYAMHFSLPPLDEQQKIVEILSTVDRKLGIENERKDRLVRIKRGLMNDLLTGRRRVEVN